MPVYRLVRKQQIPASPEAIWGFFSDAKNLQAITPAYMKFRVTSGDLPSSIYPGQVITYKVSPLLGIPLFWMTEITAVKHGRMFVDEQRRGPWKMWHHQHHFEANDEGVLMTDIVHYQPPLGWLGAIAQWFFLKKQVHSIFEYRRLEIEKRFGKPAGQQWNSN